MSELKMNVGDIDIEVMPVVHAKWVHSWNRSGTENSYLICSHCMKISQEGGKFCHECGAIMDEVTE